MADSDARKERFQGNTFENNEDAALYERYLKVSELSAANAMLPAAR